MSDPIDPTGVFDEAGWADLSEYEDLGLPGPPNVTPAQVRAILSPVPKEARFFDRTWATQLVKNGRGDILPTVDNLVKILDGDEDWAGVIGYNLFSSQMVFLGKPPFDRLDGAWSDVDDINVQCWLERSKYAYRGGLETVRAALSVVSHKHAYHPVRDYLSALTWDGVKRIDQWLALAVGAEDNAYTRAVGAKWLIQAVARVFVPGCKAETMLILEGDQGWSKTKTAELLCHNMDWFTNDIGGKMGSKESKECLNGRWVVEIGELAAMANSEVEDVKNFIQTRIDKYRPAYGRRVAEYKRQCVFFGSVNTGSHGYLKDETGARRFWPVAQSRPVDMDWMVSNVEQMWAEARERYEDGEIWYLDPETDRLARVEQEQRYAHDEWQSLIGSWVIGKDEVTIYEIMMRVLDVPIKEHSKATQMRVGKCLHILGWRRSRPMRNGVRVYVYNKPTC